VPRGAAVRRLPFGLGRDLTTEVDFDRDARYWLGLWSIDDLAYGPGVFVPVVKMDVEGHEASAIRGAERLLAERKPHVVGETHSEDLDARCRGLLEDHGYTVEAVDPHRWVPEVRMLGFNRWCVARGDTGGG
jgi:Methyltransferase FkbM domain